MAYFSRSQWGAAPRKRNAVRMDDAGVTSIFIHYNGTPINLTGFKLPQAIQRYHLTTRTSNYRDVAYSFLVDNKGNRFEGRGFNDKDGATSPAEAGRSYSIFVGVGQGQKVSIAALAAIKVQINLINAHVGRGLNVKAHRDAWATACPGEALTEWIRRGLPVANDVPNVVRPVVVLPVVQARSLPSLGSALLSEGDWRNRLPWRRARVYAMQDALGSLGYGLVGHGVWGSATRRAVLSFGKDHSLISSGYHGKIVVGPRFWGALEAALAKA